MAATPARWLDQRGLSESGVILFTAVIVGIGAGLGAVVFRRLIEGVHRLAYDGLAGAMLAAVFARTHHHGFPVVDEAGELAGVVSIQDLEGARAADTTTAKAVVDIATRSNHLIAYPYEPMWKALRQLGRRDVGRLPVVEEEGTRRLVGTVRRVDIIRVYVQAIAARAHHQHQAKVLRLGQVDGTSFLHLRIPPTSPAVGQRISELGLPEECLIVSVRRGRKLHMVHGYTVLKGGDRVTVFVDSECAQGCSNFWSWIRTATTQTLLRQMQSEGHPFLRCPSLLTPGGVPFWHR